MIFRLGFSSAFKCCLFIRGCFEKIPGSVSFSMFHNSRTDIKSLATVQKIITEILPPSSGQTFAKDARDLLMECCVEFITLISSEANDISEKEAKKTIACEHVEKALRDLGFGDYIQDVLAVAEEHKEALKVGFAWRVHLMRLFADEVPLS